MADAPFDLEKAHRWFAIELNNLSWDLFEAPDRSGEADQQMIHAAQLLQYATRAIAVPPLAMGARIRVVNWSSDPL